MPHVHHHHHLIFTILFFTFRFTCGGEKDTHTKREREREREIMWSGSKYIGLVIKQTLIYFSSCSLWFIFDDYLVSEEMYVIEKDKGYGVMESKTRRPLSLSLSLSLFRSPSKPFSTQTHQPTLLSLSLSIPYILSKPHNHQYNHDHFSHFMKPPLSLSLSLSLCLSS